ncbi:hypothetical protein [Fredinandcohnia quinoae]|uniref:Uncharacterized protein n=1 Tax=Fredinandcohnia quinoae TaxID=2918902 RepID=A0AAW5E9B3_9BACI|nr:hypothetical protein [Fredinandcohnia sp. SECRCQ15]MCH1625698.1 hypothetical protein [Fredinandcohnia sp. SECRCQ15]
MMEWALVILFCGAICLLILSFYKSKQASKSDQRAIDLFSISVMEEINQLQSQLRNIEIDNEILAHETNVKTGNTDEMLLLRDVLDLYKRGYSIEGIAAEKQQPESEIEKMLSPYMKSKIERRKIANEC